jgi:hypothetical protein
MLLFLLSGVLLLRFAARAFLALLFQEPPRLTRLEPPIRYPPIKQKKLGAIPGYLQSP